MSRGGILTLNGKILTGLMVLTGVVASDLATKGEYSSEITFNSIENYTPRVSMATSDQGEAYLFDPQKTPIQEGKKYDVSSARPLVPFIFPNEITDATESRGF